eukprot:9500782-Pyramimonas_sp.AAC.1
MRARRLSGARGAGLTWRRERCDATMSEVRLREKYFQDATRWAEATVAGAEKRWRREWRD